MKGLDIGLHFQLLAQCTDYYCSVDVLSLLRSRFISRSRFWTIIISGDPVYVATQCAIRASIFT